MAAPSPWLHLLPAQPSTTSTSLPTQGLPRAWPQPQTLDLMDEGHQPSPGACRCEELAQVPTGCPAALPSLPPWALDGVVFS